MKRIKKNTAWYNTRSKEVGGILLESRRDVERYVRDLRGGPRAADTYPGFQMTVR